MSDWMTSTTTTLLLVHVTDADGEPVWFDVSRLLLIGTYRHSPVESSATRRTKITLATPSGNHNIMVRETPDEVMFAIKRAVEGKA